jgi:hypothetical protein
MYVHRAHLAEIAHARSGDKGNHANIAVLAYTPAGFKWLRKHLSSEVVQRYFSSLNPSRVERFEAANVQGLNFVLYDVLTGGASRSLRVDTQGKTLAIALLQMELQPPLGLQPAMYRPRAKTTKNKKSTTIVQDTFEVLGLFFGRKWRKGNG